MREYFLIWGTVLFVCFIIYPVNTDNKCYQAKICVHDGKEKCGRDGDGNIRRFLDSCDIREYNCLRGAGYTKVNDDECHDLPSIDKQVSKETAKKVKNEEDDQPLNGEDSENQDNTANVEGEENKSQHDSNEKNKKM